MEKKGKWVIYAAAFDYVHGVDDGAHLETTGEIEWFVWGCVGDSQDLGNVGFYVVTVGSGCPSGYEVMDGATPVFVDVRAYDAECGTDAVFNGVELFECGVCGRCGLAYPFVGRNADVQGVIVPDSAG